MRTHTTIKTIGIAFMLLVALGDSNSQEDKPKTPKPNAGSTASVPKELTIDLGSGLKMEFVLVPPGQFIMGNNKGQPAEKPKHLVKIKRPFYLGKYPVRVSEFQQFVNSTGYKTDEEKDAWGARISERLGVRQPVNWKQPGFPQDGNHPVVRVSWNDSQEFSKWATRQSGYTVRLPTEAEWEYAARGPKSLNYPWGDEWMPGKVSIGTIPVGSDGRKPSWCGAFDMVANNWQWCKDWYSDTYYAHSPGIDPTGPEKGENRVRRGGSRVNKPEECTASTRGGNDPRTVSFNLGFRVAVDLPKPAKDKNNKHSGTD